MYDTGVNAPAVQKTQRKQKSGKIYRNGETQLLKVDFRQAEVGSTTLSPVKKI